MMMAESVGFPRRDVVADDVEVRKFGANFTSYMCAEIAALAKRGTKAWHVHHVTLSALHAYPSLCYNVVISHKLFPLW